MVGSPCRLAVAEELTTASAVRLSGAEGLEYDPASRQGGGARSRSGPDRPSLTQNHRSCSLLEGGRYAPLSERGRVAANRPSRDRGLRVSGADPDRVQRRVQPPSPV